MKINFTKKQFKTLIDLVYTGEMIINGNRIPDKVIEEYDELQQYIYSFAKEMGYEDLIEYNKEYNGYYETRKYDESGIYDFIVEYDNNVFWDELASNLAKRDIANKYRDEIDNMEHEDVVTAIWTREDEYSEEFSENGLLNLKVDL